MPFLDIFGGYVSSLEGKQGEQFHVLADVLGPLPWYFYAPQFISTITFHPWDDDRFTYMNG